MVSKLAIVTDDILQAFGLDFNSEISTFHGGHINDTFLVKTAHRKYMLQRINKFVFKKPEHIMTNILNVTEFLHKKIIDAGGNPEREALTIVRTIDEKIYYIDNNAEYWRCLIFIDGTKAYESASNANMLFEAGFAFGNFQNSLSDYPADTLFEIIKDFHNTPVRYEQLITAAKEDKIGRLSSVKAEIDFAKARKEDTQLLMKLFSDGKLPNRVTHNDTKMSNILFDENTGKAICTIDLDTVMPGLAAFDFGDSIRAGAATAAEDEVDLSLVNFNLEYFEAYAKGYLKAAGKSLTETEINTLANGAVLITLEVGMRFLADYLNGDVYFKIAYPQHNLDRARNQFKLASEMEKQLETMNEIILRLI